MLAEDRAQPARSFAPDLPQSGESRDVRSSLPDMTMEGVPLIAGSETVILVRLRSLT